MTNANTGVTCILPMHTEFTKGTEVTIMSPENIFMYFTIELNI